MAKCCLRCDTDDHAGPEEEAIFRSGEVFGIQESVFTPIEEILYRLSGLAGQALRRSRSSFHSLCKRANATHKRRPCILMDQTYRVSDKGVKSPRVCLMCTFEKTPIDDLPQIFRHFCLQVYTELADVLETAHIHSIPIWPLHGEMQWIIMWPFQTTREMLGRWPRRGSKAGCGQRMGMAFGKKAMSQLDMLCKKKAKEWKAFCVSQPGFAEEQEDKIRKYKKTWKPSTTGSLTASRGSLESSALSAWRLGQDTQSIVSQTIHEDQVSLFDEKTPYAIYQPGVGTAESVRPKHTRRASKGSNRTSNAASLASVNGAASVCSMAPKHRSPTREVFTNFTKRIGVVAPWGTA
ncbi:hypothetical protein TRAPUB_730 [Trametes pubescens]|uniref:Uncharacterized protein n=1 Tax=Trametes pubescens TaxID=154538 RepID=A0A1M2VL94_TRAPU|nr:hypothetical protein TRAPUB_730 [Trametes pubescens]